MTLAQLAVQLYTLRDHCRSAADLAATAHRVRVIGYPAVEVSGVGDIPDVEIASILQGEGLSICAAHLPSGLILDEPARAVDRLKQLGCRLGVYPFPHGIDFTDAAQVRDLARRLDAAGAVFRAAGLTLAYHHHAIEFVRHEGAPALDYIFNSTDPQNLSAELDTYWIHYGGGDVIGWCRRLRGRLACIHLKDYGFHPENRPMFAGIGEGTLPFARIIAEAEAAGCGRFVVEQDVCPGDPFVSIARSYDYIKTHLVG